MPRTRKRKNSGKESSAEMETVDKEMNQNSNHRMATSREERVKMTEEKQVLPRQMGEKHEEKVKNITSDGEVDSDSEKEDDLRSNES